MAQNSLKLKKPVPMMPAYQSMLRNRNKGYESGVNLSLTASRYDMQSGDYQARQQLESIQQEMNDLKSMIFEDLARAEANAARFRDIERRLAMMIPIDSSQVREVEANQISEEISELSSKDTRCDCQSDPTSSEVSSFQESSLSEEGVASKSSELNSGEEVKHEPEASPPLVGPVPDEKFDDSVCQRLTMQYHLREQPSGTKEEEPEERKELLDTDFIINRLRELKAQCASIKSAVNRITYGTDINPVVPEYKLDMSKVERAGFGRGRGRITPRLTGVFLNETPHCTDGKAFWMGVRVRRGSLD